MAAAAGAVIESTNTIGGAFNTLRNAGAPVAGTNEVWTLTIGGTPSAGATSGVKFNYQGLVSALCLWSATSATFVTNLQTCLDAFFGTGATVVTDSGSTAGVGDFLITFSGAALAKKNLTAVATVTNALTGSSPTATAARTTPGVDATFRQASAGQLLTDTTNAVLYQNRGSSGAPTWNTMATEVQYAPSLLAADGAINSHTPAYYVVTKGTAAALTLAAPTAGTDDGVQIIVTSRTAAAHTLTATGLLNTGTANVNLATFAARAGAGLTLVADNGKWNVVASVGITFT